LGYRQEFEPGLYQNFYALNPDHKTSYTIANGVNNGIASIRVQLLLRNAPDRNIERFPRRESDLTLFFGVHKSQFVSSVLAAFVYSSPRDPS
jgi:hypothetical protein